MKNNFQEQLLKRQIAQQQKANAILTGGLEGAPIGQSATNLDPNITSAGSLMQKQTSQWMAYQVKGERGTPEYDDLWKRLNKEWGLLETHAGGAALAEINIQLQKPDFAVKLGDLVKKGATVGEVAAYALAPKGSIAVNGTSQEIELRKIEDRIYHSQKRGVVEHLKTAGMMMAVPATVFGAGISVGTLAIAVQGLGVKGAVDFVSAPVAAGVGLLAGAVSYRTVAGAINAKNVYEKVRQNPEKLNVLDPNEKAHSSSRMELLHENMSAIPHADRHLIKHLNTKEMQIFLLGDDEIRRGILESNPPSQMARMEADIAGMNKVGVSGLYKFLKGNIDPGFKTSSPHTPDGGIEGLESRLKKWRELNQDVELPGRKIAMGSP